MTFGSSPWITHGSHDKQKHCLSPTKKMAFITRFPGLICLFIAVVTAKSVIENVKEPCYKPELDKGIKEVM